MTFLEIALDCIRRGWWVFPCKPRSKEPAVHGGFYAATLAEDQVRAWWTEWPDANVAIATGASGLTVLDCDHGLNDLDDLRHWRERSGLPWTYAVHTGRRDSYGVQLYYQGSGVKSIPWADGDYSGDIRGASGYVMAAGSVHPDSGETYEVLFDGPVMPVPNYVLGLKSAPIPGAPGKPNERVTDDGGLITDHRNVHMISLLGAKRAQGYDDDALRAYAIDTNANRMVPPLDDDELDKLVRNACKFPLPEPEPDVMLGGRIAGEPLAPVDWRTRYHTKMEVENTPPPEFLIDGFLLYDSITGLAAPVGQRKSLIALNVAHALTTGEPLFGKFPVTRKPSRVLYLCPEMGLRSFAGWLKLIGLTSYVCDTLFVRTMNKEDELKLPNLVPEELDDAVVILDTAIRFIEGAEDKAEDMKRFAAQVFGLMKGEKKAAAILLLHHSAKGTKEADELTLENVMRGSGELGAFLTSCWGTRLQNPKEQYKSASFIENVKQRDFESKPFEATCDAFCRMHYVESDQPVVLAKRKFTGQQGRQGR